MRRGAKYFVDGARVVDSLATIRAFVAFEIGDANQPAIDCLGQRSPDFADALLRANWAGLQGLHSYGIIRHVLLK